MPQCPAAANKLERTSGIKTDHQDAHLLDRCANGVRHARVRVCERGNESAVVGTCTHRDVLGGGGAPRTCLPNMRAHNLFKDWPMVTVGLVVGTKPAVVSTRRYGSEVGVVGRVRAQR